MCDQCVVRSWLLVLHEAQRLKKVVTSVLVSPAVGVRHSASTGVLHPTVGTSVRAAQANVNFGVLFSGHVVWQATFPVALPYPSDSGCMGGYQDRGMTGVSLQEHRINWRKAWAS